MGCVSFANALFASFMAASCGAAQAVPPPHAQPMVNAATADPATAGDPLLIAMKEELIHLIELR